MRTDADAISGVVPVMPTPFVPCTEDVDAAALRKLVDFAASVGLGAVCLPAYGSEYYKLTDEERLQVVEEVVAHAAGRFSVVAQCSGVCSSHLRCRGYPGSNSGLEPGRSDGRRQFLRRASASLSQLPLPETGGASHGAESASHPRGDRRPRRGV